MCFNNPVADCKSESATVFFCGVKRLKDAWQVFGLDAMTIILYGNVDSILLVPQPNIERTPLLAHGIHCIDKEIE